MVVLRSIWGWLSISVLILVWVPVMWVTNLFDRDEWSYATGRQFRRLGWMMVAVNPMWRVEITGAYPANIRNPYIVVCNHQSFADIPVVSRLPWDMKWVGKAEMFRLPVLGWLMRKAKDVAVDRADRRSRAAVMIEVAKRIRGHMSVMIMPEGTRSPDGRVLPFNDGAFKLAMKLGVPVLPLALDGTFDMLPRSGWKFGPPRTIRLHVFDPIDTSTWDDGMALTAHVRSMIMEQIAAWRGLPVSDVDTATAPAATNHTVGKNSGSP